MQVRIRREAAPYTMVPNPAIRQDRRMSWKALGLLTYLLSHMDGFVIKMETILGVKRDGKEAVYSGLKELEELGYLRRTKIRDHAGKFVELQFEVFGHPADRDADLAAIPEADLRMDLDQEDQEAQEDQNNSCGNPDKSCANSGANVGLAVSGKSVSGKPVSGKSVSGKSMSGFPIYGKSETKNTRDQEEDQGGEPPLPPQGGGAAELAQQLMDAWNGMVCAAVPKAKRCASMAARMRHVRARHQDPYFRANWREAMRKILEVPFLRGEVPTEKYPQGFAVNMDYFLRPGSVVKLMEDYYGGRDGSKDRSQRRAARGF